MGHLTNYSLSAKPDPNGVAMRDALALHDGAGAAFWRSNAEDCKWYAHHEDMIALSKAHPSYVWRLAGLDEDGDHWVKFYCAGRVESHRRPRWDPPADPTPAFVNLPRSDQALPLREQLPDLQRASERFLLHCPVSVSQATYSEDGRMFSGVTKGPLKSAARFNIYATGRAVVQAKHNPEASDKGAKLAAWLREEGLEVAFDHEGRW